MTLEEIAAETILKMANSDTPRNVLKDGFLKAYQLGLEHVSSDHQLVGTPEAPEPGYGSGV